MLPVSVPTRDLAGGTGGPCADRPLLRACGEVWREVRLASLGEEDLS